MTKAEAIKLEKEVDKLFTLALGEDCECSLNLAGRLKISFNGNMICMRPSDGAIDWVRYEGFYDELAEYIAKILECKADNKEMIDKLIWSYEHVTELED